MDTFDFVMTEHHAWWQGSSSRHRVFVLPSGERRWATDTALSRLGTGVAAPPICDGVTLHEGVLAPVPELAVELSGLGLVGRYRNSDLWNALATAIIRQVIRAAQSKKLYRSFALAYGERITLPSGETYALFPSAEIVLRLSDEAFSALGMAFKRRPLRQAAEAYLAHSEKWQQLTAVELLAVLPSVPGIGAWTAGAAVADWCNDFALYPYSDLAVRTWATRAAPSYDWPRDETAFGELWRMLAGDHLSLITLLTLAWGSQHGDIG